jgi:hypothetical protein
LQMQNILFGRRTCLSAFPPVHRKSNPDITKFMEQHSFGDDYSKLESFYIQKWVDWHKSTYCIIPASCCTKKACYLHIITYCLHIKYKYAINVHAYSNLIAYSA